MLFFRGGGSLKHRPFAAGTASGTSTTRTVGHRITYSREDLQQYTGATVDTTNLYKDAAGPYIPGMGDCVEEMRVFILLRKC